MKIAILGGGQLARMLCLAAYPLGIEIVCVDPKLDCSVKNMSATFCADYSEVDKIFAHLKNIDCVTYELEALPIQSLQQLARQLPIYPSVDILAIAQDRFLEKKLFTELDIPTTEYQCIDTAQAIKNFIDLHSTPVFIKTRRDGYDGKGQIRVNHIDESETSFNRMPKSPLIIEQGIPYDFEVSLISVRNQQGDIRFYPLTLNKHIDGILRVSEAPFVNGKLQESAESYARRIMEKFNYIGVMTIEFFCVDGRLLANEIAPRVHNSGHWTIEGAHTSQFENHIRAISGLPLGSVAVTTLSRMVNIIGTKPDPASLVSIPGLHYHWYGKDPLPGRKLGHITICEADRVTLDQHYSEAIRMIGDIG